MTQNDRILALLRSRGEQGFNVTEFAAPAVVDDGKPIMRVAARIGDLKDLGYEIETRIAENGTASYFLAEDLPDPHVQPQAVAEVSGLFDSDSFRTVAGAYESEAA